MALLTSLLIVNSGSSSLKASLFRADGSRQDFRYPRIGLGSLADHQAAFDTLLHALSGDVPAVVGHRLVHGGPVVDPARRIDDAERARLETLIPLAPLHLPANLLGIDLCRAHFAVPQIACFDTAFHATLPELAWRLPIPQSLGLRRFGFHGLNYAHIASCLPDLLGETARGKVLVAHLGNGASLCLLDHLRSVDTSMGYTPAGGIPMGTRSGDLDPGVMLELGRTRSHDELEQLVFHGMGLLALSDGESSDMATLLASSTQAARFAVDYFCRQVSGAIGGFAARAGGLDALVFTGGIGEHAADVRARICAPLAYMGFTLDSAENRRHATRLHTTASRPVLRIQADEERRMHDLVVALYDGKPLGGQEGGDNPHQGLD